MKNKKKILLIFTLIFLFFPFFISAQARQKENLPHDQRATGKMISRSRLAFDPGINAANASQFSVSDGSNPLSYAYEPGAFPTSKYIKTDGVKKDKTLSKIRSRTLKYYEKERKKRARFHDKLRRFPYTPEEVQEKILRYGQKEIRDRKKFTEKQQRRMRKVLCQNIEDKKNRKKCEKGEL